MSGWVVFIDIMYITDLECLIFSLINRMKGLAVTRIKQEMVDGNYVGLYWMSNIHSHYITDLNCLIFSLVNRMKGLLPESNRRC